MVTSVAGRETAILPGVAFASFSQRLGALLIDLVVGIVIVFALALVGLTQFGVGDDPGSLQPHWPTLLLNALISSGYVIVLNGMGGTLGKRLMGLRVIDATGAAPGLQKAFVRSLVWLIPALLQLVSDWLVWETSDGGLYVLIDLVIIVISFFALYDAWSMRGHDLKQTIHDRMAGTYVVKEPA
jgi:uncharacterized RDD family membrane protein YckC